MNLDWGSTVLAKIRLVVANYIPRKKIEDGWAELVFVNIRLILLNDERY